MGGAQRGKVAWTPGSCSPGVSSDLWWRNHIKSRLEAAASPEIRATAVGGRGEAQGLSQAVTHVPGAGRGDGKNECWEARRLRLLLRESGCEVLTGPCRSQFLSELGLPPPDGLAQKRLAAQSQAGGSENR